MAGEQFTRTRQLLGDEAMERLARARVAVFGIGGVGGYVCEGLVRSGVGRFDLIDRDSVDPSNLNRQIIATTRTVGRAKTEVMRERMLEINPAAQIRTHACFFLPETADAFDFSEYDYVVDAVDTVTAKIELILRAQRAGVPVISAMGAGNKLDPSRLRVADIYRTSVCPLARTMRRELRKRGVEHLKVVFSDEEPRRPLFAEADRAGADTAAGPAGADPAGKEPAGEAAGRRKDVPASAVFVPAAAGLLIAAEVVKDLRSLPEKQKD